ncbi:ribosomal large subunit pseudouridine synthase D [Proteiniborus ethanoligenes]|uniref:Pseudouridine synthase n=1 Tax=Proteiniborus ethanoligenes TaxID=415015 RepID=A0A1H3QU36_9FIRM|nr:RluA family pseudouridine synthase [Proteiniborus ethanoligenes]SDZ16840.1 ribosomal large subunit pseudouridine synthase D [Proteiniborus ethanoligenes]
MEILEIFVDEEDNERLDVYLSQEISDFSRSYIQKLIKDELVKVNNKVVKAKYIVNEGDHIKVHLPKPKKLDIEPENIPVEIIYEDDDIAIVNKPQGMVVHPAPGNYSGTLVNALLYHLNSLSNINGIIRPGIVHRIDKDTSGILMIAKNNLAHEELSKQLKEHTINRIYNAIVDGNIKEENGTINAPIGRHPIDRKKMTVTDSNSKEAVTHFKVLERFGQYTLIQAKLETGRTHQIRVHMNYINHPVTGDPVYGRKNQKFNTNGQLLHAKTIGFIHPRTKEYLEFDSVLPKHFMEIIHILKKLAK